MMRPDATPARKGPRAGAVERRAYLPGQLLVMVDERAVRPHLGAGPLTLARREARRLPEAVAGPFDHLRRNCGLRAVEPLFSTRRAALARRSDPAPVRQRLAVLASVSDSESDELTGITLLRLDPKKVTAGLLRTLNASRAIRFAEPMPARWLASETADPLQNRQWGLRAVHWFDAARPDAAGIRVAVLDTGVDRKHPDFQGVDIQYDHGGFMAADVLGHGTHVCGIIGAATNNGAGISGISRCAFAVWKIFPDEPDEDGEFYVDGGRYLQALRAILRSDARVLNLSLGGTASSRTEQILFSRLAREGVVVAAAMGNEYLRGNPTEYPAAYAGVLAVGSVAENLDRSPFSNTGRHTGLVAPGSNILSTLPMKPSRHRSETEYAAWSGTSMATPHVAAAAALVTAREPTASADAVKRRLQSTATRLAAMGGRARTREYGSGLLNLKEALQPDPGETS